MSDVSPCFFLCPAFFHDIFQKLHCRILPIPTSPAVPAIRPVPFSSAAGDPLVFSVLPAFWCLPLQPVCRLFAILPPAFYSVLPVLFGCVPGAFPPIPAGCLPVLIGCATPRSAFLQKRISGRPSGRSSTAPGPFSGFRCRPRARKRVPRFWRRYSISLHYRFMSLPVIDFFICLAVRAYSSLNFFYKPVSQTPLLIPCPFTHGTLNAFLSHLSIFIRNRSRIHIHPRH